jgi:hypothetical protein
LNFTQTYSSSEERKRQLFTTNSGHGRIRAANGLWICCDRRWVLVSLI